MVGACLSAVRVAVLAAGEGIVRECAVVRAGRAEDLGVFCYC